ncbi:MAG: ABC transporter ATP-binding protein [Clostridiales bacterium]|jgi:ABC-2 type transport system ATP-binding protein|nr:ABC transporter ATP-binding protein [Clostridiales bacterium]
MLLRTENLTKRYGKFLALDQMNLEVDEGEIFGFVGPNGAGKTTTMRILATLMTATAGDAYIDDISVRKSPFAIRKVVGYMPDFFGVYDNLRVSEYLEFYADANNIPKRDWKAITKQLLELVNSSDKENAFVDSLSRGMKQRLCLARCLIHDPKLLILDEPSSGMDPQARAEVKYILRALKEQGKSIFISSHILPELGELCDRIAIINHGTLVTMGTMDEISRNLGGQNKIKLTFLSEEDMEQAIAVLRAFPFVGEIVREDKMLEVAMDGDEKEAAELQRALILAGVNLTSFQRSVQSLEQIFLEVISQ